MIPSLDEKEGYRKQIRNRLAANNNSSLHLSKTQIGIVYIANNLVLFRKRCIPINIVSIEVVQKLTSSACLTLCDGHNQMAAE